MVDDYHKNRLKAEAIPTIFENIAEDNLNVEQLRVPRNDSFISHNTPSCSTSTVSNNISFFDQNYISLYICT